MKRRGRPATARRTPGARRASRAGPRACRSHPRRPPLSPPDVRDCRAYTRDLRRAGRDTSARWPGSAPRRGSSESCPARKRSCSCRRPHRFRARSPAPRCRRGGRPPDRNAEHGIGAKRERVEIVVVNPPVDDVDTAQALGGLHVQDVVPHHQVAPFDQLGAQLVGQETCARRRRRWRRRASARPPPDRCSPPAQPHAVSAATAGRSLPPRARGTAGTGAAGSTSSPCGWRSCTTPLTARAGCPPARRSRRSCGRCRYRTRKPMCRGRAGRRASRGGTAGRRTPCRPG